MTIDEVTKYFQDNNYKVSKDKYIPIEHKCRYGVRWIGEWKGSYGEIWRSWDLMRHCCCWVCHNHDCKKPKNEIIKGCDHVCDLWTKIPYCEIYKLKKDIKEYKSILNELYEDYDTWGDPHEEIPMYEQLLKETEDKLKEYENKRRIN